MAKEALEALKKNKGDSIQIQQSLDVLAYGSWEGISKHEIRKVVGNRLQKGSVLERRLNRQDMEVKPLPELRPPKAFFPQAEMIEFRTALEAWQCTPECKKKLSYLYTTISDYGQLQATTQAEMRMRQHWRSLVSESKWRAVLEFGTWNVDTCWKLLLESTTTLLSEDEDKLLDFLSSECNLSNPLLQSMRAARKNKNADSANPLLAMRAASKNADAVIS
ncbi:hypothetical protein SELMODRAFT_426703 [Selaginella moellendorffii]|uniref:Uncharacterized protein n=1 Tax=Selaginella moellendorffii TaxID=88036 RepID=D8SX83_SELML|nr:hypothetical protein SELMODRAFT_426703 [Selaginella moellendorffii]